MNYHDLLNIRYKTHVKFILLCLVILGLIGFLLEQKVSDVYSTYGYVSNDTFVVNIPIDYPDTLNKMEYLKINDIKTNGEIIDISEVLLDSQNLINYQEVTWKLDTTFLDNQVLKVNIYYNKEKVLNKLKKMIWR